ncbi:MULTISPECIES: hypothetical protein [Streptomyces]|jgi:hypothetical protein|uniref:hypothetical protein n=1 Tax=Streptomyces TaxID=1883 RepID=UPI0019254762|nr:MULTISPECIES: hypothetical protein [Streptomyces]MDF9871835.1 hypothetical protein [Streptomyces pratensis]MDF6063067.1 hypothetical protein [Streptomyces sp. JH010]MDX2624737.1 hypothetical protein [Streptomyces sp. WI03-5b]MEE1778732.1 hypothetical protein [Streptomyces sp. JV181]WJY32075.1 hypothetical protein QTO28_14145 [Streptomyces sp. P9-2B-1]
MVLVPLLGTLMLISLATAAASIVTVALMVNNRPLPLPRVCAVLVLLFGSSAAVAYCYGWFSVTLGGPFPALCEDRNASGADLTRTAQEYWPLRSACVYSDGAVVEHISMSINLLVYLLAGIAIVLAIAGAVRHRLTPSTSEGSLGKR